MAPSEWQFAHADSKVSHHHSLATMDWVAQSGDTLNHLARSFYPKQPAMQRLFVRQALKLNPHRQLTDSSPLLNGEAILLPSLKALSYASRVHSQASSASAIVQTEATSDVQISPTSQGAYEQLLARNLKIQQQLAEVLDKQVRLQAQMNALMMTLQQQSVTAVQQQTALASQVSEMKEADVSSSSTKLSSSTESTSTAIADKKALEDITKRTSALQKDESNPQTVSPQVVVESADQASEKSTQVISSTSKPIKKSTVVIRSAKPVQATEINQYEQWFKFDSWSDILLWLGLLMLMVLIAGAAFIQTKKKLDARASAQQQADWQPSVLEFVNTSEVEPIAKKSRMDKRVQSLLSQVGILISANRESDAQVMLEKFIQLYPKHSVFPWLYLLELHRSNQQQEAYAHVVEHLHSTFNVERAAWKDEASSMVVESQLDAFPHIILELERIWKTDEATQYLKDLQLDKRGGERQGFSLEVLKEIAVLQNVLEIRALQSQVA